MTDIYVAGEMLNAAGARTATYWKNGVATVLGDPSAVFSDACCVAISGDDVYVAGNEQFADHVVAVVWKNGVLTRLSDGSSDAVTHGIGLVGNDVYVSGTDGGATNAVLWKNGQEQILPSKGMGSIASGLTVHGSSVYVVGRVNDRVQATGAQGGYPALWTDGVLSFPEGEDYFGEATVITFSGNDVYIGGESIPLNSAAMNPVYWKNGTMVALAAPSSTGLVYTMVVNGEDVYVGGDLQVAPSATSAGGDRARAMVWKNGVATDYSGTADASFVNALAFANGSLYAAGTYFPSAAFWKDGVLTELATGVNQTSHSYPGAYGMTVVTH